MINSSLLKPQKQNYKVFSNRSNSILHLSDDKSITTLLYSTDTIPKDDNNVIVMVRDTKRIVFGNIQITKDYIRITTTNAKLYFAHSEVSILGIIRSYTVRNHLVN